eukprot:Skav209549  [mRNA]  locus=scaffold2497:331514:334211:+ [translate_table: standard]
MVRCRKPSAIRPGYPSAACARAEFLCGSVRRRVGLTLRWAKWRKAICRSKVCPECWPRFRPRHPREVSGINCKCRRRLRSAVLGVF